jgi:hypothetical protein
MSFEKSPVAVALARTLLVVIAVITFALGAGLYFSGVILPTWQWVLLASVGTGHWCLLVLRRHQA